MNGPFPRDEGPDGDQRLVRTLFAPESLENPYQAYPGVEVPGCRHAVAAAMLRDDRLGPPALSASAQESLWSNFSRWLINLDGERHLRMRHRFSGVFRARKIEQYRPAIEARATALIDAVLDAGRMDLVSQFARPLPFSIICDVLGVPEDRRQWLAARMIVLDIGFARQGDPAFVGQASEAVDDMLDFFAALYQERVRSPRDDLLSALAEDPPADDEELRDLLANCVFFIEAGHVTTTSLITGGTLLLLQHPRERERLGNDPQLVGTAVEEMLRLVSPVGVVLCRAREDAEIDGYRFRAGEQRLVFPAGANRDPEAFVDADTFDIARDPNPHLAFSAGRHFCLGAPLARLHGEVAISLLFRRLPGLTLEGEATWLGSFPIREPLSATVSWKA